MRACVAASVFALVAGCPGVASGEPAGGAAPPPPPTTAPARLPLATGVAIVDSAGGPQRFRIELAVKPHERERGLMFREHLDDDEGMMFFFERQQPLSFWMKNTWIPLDMLFIDEDLVVKGIVENAEPLTTTSRRIPAPTRFVLELKGGTARRLGITAGARVRLEGVPEALWQKTPPAPSAPPSSPTPSPPTSSTTEPK